MASAWEWWSRHWVRVQAIATPIGSLTITLIMAQYWGGELRNSQPYVAVLGTFASIGILIYTSFFAALEPGVIIVVLAWKVKEYFDREREKRQQELRNEGSLMWREAERLSRETGEPVGEIFERLNKENWKPSQA